MLGCFLLFALKGKRAADGSGCWAAHPERDGLDDVRAAEEAAVDDDSAAAAHRLHHLRQHGQRAHAGVQLPPAVVRDPCAQRRVG